MQIAKLLLFSFSLISFSLSAQEIKTLEVLESELKTLVTPSKGDKDLAQIKSILSQRSIDIDIAAENYLIAKKQVSVARAAFNPIRTGHVLGIALGMEYLWTPILIDAVISIPTKLFNVSKNKYLAKASSYNYEATKERLFNEMAKLYYDIITHKMILESIDLEIKIRNEYDQKLGNTTSALKIENKKATLKLGIERTDIYKLYSAELAAFRTMLTYDINSLKSVNLAPVAYSLSSDTVDSINLTRLEDLAVVRSNSHKVVLNIHRAALENVKGVRWSLLSFSGLNFSYGRRVRVAKNEVEIARLEIDSSEITLKNGARDTLNKLESSIRVSENYGAITHDSRELYLDIHANWQDGGMNDETVVRSALDLIRDYRSEIVARYRSLSALDDFSYASHVSVTPKVAASSSLQDQIRKNSLYGLTHFDYKVIGKRSGNFLELSLRDRVELDLVESVDYVFNTKTSKRKDSDNRASGFRVRRALADNEGQISGEAFVTLKNGHEYIVDFRF